LLLTFVKDLLQRVGHDITFNGAKTKNLKFHRLMEDTATQVCPKLLIIENYILSSDMDTKSEMIAPHS
jgi:hypothetical protein